MKTKSKISGYITGGVVYAVFLAVAFIAASSAFDLPNRWHRSAVATVGYGSMAKSPSQPRAFSFVERVAYQRAIEDVYWRHRIWPRTRGENPDPKPSLDAVMSQAQLEKKVAGYLRDSLALQDYWQKPITAQQLQAEMDRMARDTKQPEVLRELFEALGNDPAVIAECLARPILAQRLIADFSAQDQTRHVESPPSEALGAMSAAATFGQVIYTLPEIADAGDPLCIDNWTATTTSNAPQHRSKHTAVWTGSEMIVWGGAPYTSTGGRYNPSTDSWIATSMTNAPSARAGHTAVWTGTEMIVWGGAFYDFHHFLNTGGRYNPSTDSWTATSMTNAPEARRTHTAVWTGSEMIVWGGYDTNQQTNTGGRYDPETDSWIATSMTNAPTARSLHTAVWTGSEMIVWGGRAYPGPFDLNTGGRYNPSADSWITTSMTNTPTAREQHTAVWTGSEMIIWGGWGEGGGRYNPGTDGWTRTNTTNAPSGRYAHTAIWTGSEMIVWGGLRGATPLNTGGRYNPTMDSWAATSTFNAPDRRYSHTTIWTGSEMIVWGGNGSNTGGRYCGQYAPTLTIIQPNGGEVWLMGSVHDIKWEGNNMTQTDRLIIQYSRDGGAGWFRIAQDVPALSFSYSWHVDNYPTTQGRVKILLQGHRSITDQSDANFTVQRRQPHITLNTPNGGEVWLMGSIHEIKWEGTNLTNNDHLIIQYSRNGGAGWFRIAQDVPALSLSYLWHVDNFPTTQGRVKILLQGNRSITDQSAANFTVQRP